MRLRSSNPVYNRVMNNDEYRAAVGEYAVATYGGVARKAIFFIALTFAGAFLGLWLMQANPAIFIQALIASVFSTFFFAVIGLAFPGLSMVFGSLFCLAEGLLIGIVSLAFELAAPGVVLSALLSTVVVVAVVATLFLTNIVKVNATFIRILLIFAISMIVSSLLLWIISSFVDAVAFNGMVVGISALSTLLATLYLLFDLERIRQVVEGGAPKAMEWYVAFGIVYTIIWLYIELLRLIFIIASAVGRNR
ncbi:MAG: Bax inhibitor-1/YccA family protein [Acholeplasmataceae bacterium]|nr:Bax inhibitor-1/YccA family protein [Acholeplasmataceae bacterium]